MSKKSPIKGKTLQLSLIERLKNDHRQKELSFEELREELIHSVEWHLQNLLNTKKPVTSLPDKFPELKVSLANYGIPDLTTVSIDSEQQKREFCQAVEEAIILFEPRLRETKVELIEDKSQIELVFRLRISSVLMIDPKPIPIRFDSLLYSDTRLFKVEGHPTE